MRIISSKQQLTLELIFFNFVEFEILLHQLHRLRINIIGHQLLDAIDFLKIPYRPKSGGSQRFQHLDSILWLLVLGLEFFVDHFGVLANHIDAEVSVELLNRVVKHGASGFVDFVGHLLLALDLDEAFIVPVHLLLDVQNLS